MGYLLVILSATAYAAACFAVHRADQRIAARADAASEAARAARCARPAPTPVRWTPPLTTLR